MNPSETAALGERLEAVRGRLAGAARIAGRKPEDVRLIAVSKLHPVAVSYTHLTLPTT